MPSPKVVVEEFFGILHENLDFALPYRVVCLPAADIMVEYQSTTLNNLKN